MPPGCWYEQGSKILQVEKDGEYVNRTYDISEIPYWISCNTILPTLSLPEMGSIGNARKNYDHLDLTLFLDVMANVSTARTDIYQDDGVSTAYLNGHYSFLHVTSSKV